MYMLHWGKSLLLPLPLIGESFDNFVLKWGNLGMSLFFFLKNLFIFILLFMTKLHIV